ncbi:hypothetical protein YE0787 [Yersinia enterocolitica subsp. enterocolitica 8081]|uniref:Uncharacterized protein n=1 Tax=Yersinia enterocolitica serotype O:8 / biotype 1B (strain NCTC 13174 / 8081) TaxID=393305 RepID=A1JJV2_YERE8|nr:hypothetical protein YE0787 [Yersinia enterocolitica subsp. enterocolitica 8081]
MHNYCEYKIEFSIRYFYIHEAGQLLLFIYDRDFPWCLFVYLIILNKYYFQVVMCHINIV